MKFFKMTVERLEVKIEKLQTENISMKHDLIEHNKAIEFQNLSYEYNLFSLFKRIWFTISRTQLR